MIIVDYTDLFRIYSTWRVHEWIFDNWQMFGCKCGFLNAVLLVIGVDLGVYRVIFLHFVFFIWFSALINKTRRVKIAILGLLTVVPSRKDFFKLVLLFPINNLLALLQNNIHQRIQRYQRPYHQIINIRPSKYAIPL